MRIVLSLLIGILCALLGVIVSNLAFVLWNSFSGIPDAGSTGDTVFTVQRVLIFLSVMILAGVLSTQNLIKTKEHVIVSSALAGATMAIVLLLPLWLLATDPVSFYYTLYTSLPPGLMASDILNYAGSTQQNLSLILQSWPIIATLLIASTIVATLAAWLTYYNVRGVNRSIPKSNLIIAVAVLVLAILVIVPAAVSVCIGQGIMAHPTTINYQVSKTIYDNTNAPVPARSNATFEFMLLDSPGIRYLDESQPFTVLIDGRQATNQTAATASGLNVKVFPETGLATTPESYIGITGIDPSHRIIIKANFRDGIRKVIFEN